MKSNLKHPNRIPKKPKPRQMETELDIILRQCELSPRAAQSADYLIRFQHKHEKQCKSIIESDSMKYDQEKLPAGERSITLIYIQSIHLSDQIVTRRWLKGFSKVIYFPIG
jgi:hypothetical protein